MKTPVGNPWRLFLVTLLSLGLGFLTPACAGSEVEEPESWTQQDDSALPDVTPQEAGFSLHNCPAGQEWDPIFGCQIMWGEPCFYTRGPEYMGTEPHCFKVPAPQNPTHGQQCSSTRGSGWCGTEPNCTTCPKPCSSTRGAQWCGYEPNCSLCPVTCASTRGPQWCGDEPSCYLCPVYCSSTRGSGWCGNEPNCYTCTNGGGTSEGG
ncbi:hypothetical protein ACN469_19100 [Corallococcus terminator]